MKAKYLYKRFQQILTREEMNRIRIKNGDARGTVVWVDVHGLICREAIDQQYYQRRQNVF